METEGAAYLEDDADRLSPDFNDEGSGMAVAVSWMRFIRLRKLVLTDVRCVSQIFAPLCSGNYEPRETTSRVRRLPAPSSRDGQGRAAPWHPSCP